MNSQQISIKHSALGWVKKSIDDNLDEATRDLKNYIEGRDKSLLEGAKKRFDVIQGVLTMAEQYGAAMLVEEMVSLCEFISKQESAGKKQGNQVFEVLLRAVLQLPDYLKRIQSGHRDILFAILPLLNDIRSIKKQDLFSEKLLFLPDLSMHRDDAEIDAIDDHANDASKQLIKKLRPTFQLSLLNVIKDNEVDENLKRFERIFDVLEERSSSEQVARIWWIIGALVESLSRHQLELGVSIKNLLGKVDALFRVLLIIGERGVLKRQPIELIKNFLYYIAQPECDGPKSQAIKTAYRLEEFLPNEADRDQLQNNIASPNQALLKTVSESVSNDIETVKATLEIYVNGDLSDAQKLCDIPHALHVISDTLVMIGFGEQRQIIEAQIITVTKILNDELKPDEEKMLAMVLELIQVEQALEQMQNRQSKVEEDDLRSEEDVSRDLELDNILVAIVTALLDDIQKTKSAILEFVKDPSRSEQMELCVVLMEQSRGALLMLNHERAVAVIDGLIQYMNDYDVVEFMSVNRLDSLSQVIVSLECYLEALGERRTDADTILDLADIQLSKLLAPASVSNRADACEEAAILYADTEISDAIQAENFAVFEEVSDQSIQKNELHNSKSALDLDINLSSQEPIEIEVTVQSNDAQTADDISLELENINSCFEPEPERHIESNLEPSPEASAFGEALIVEPVNESLVVLKPDGDPDILEIYLEEAEEEATNIARLQKDWQLHPDDSNAVKNIRRAFHTIKGSGRLVGATKIAEFSWDYELLINSVIDKAVSPNDDVINAVGKASVALLELVTELMTGKSPSSDIPYLRGLARALLEFKPTQVLTAQTQLMDAAESVYDQIADADKTSDIDTLESENGEPEPGDVELASESKNESESETSQDDKPDSEVSPDDPLELTSPTALPSMRAEATPPAIYEQDEPTGLSFEPGLLTIYQQEVEQHLSTVNTALNQAEEHKELIPVEDIYQALHTIHGASKTAGIVSIGELASLMGRPLKLAIAPKMVFDHEIIELYRDGQRALHAMMNELVATQKYPIIPNDLEISFQDLADDIEEHTIKIPEHRGPLESEFVDTLSITNDTSDDHPDDELIAIFIDEAKELIEMSDRALHQWSEQVADEEGPLDYKAVMELQRYLHTLKGGAKMAELNEIGDLSHELESMFIAVIDGRVEKNEDLVDLLKDSFDSLYQQVTQAEAGVAVSSSGEQIALLKNLRSNQGDDQSEGPAEEKGGLDSESIDIVSENFSGEAAQNSERQTQDVIKVRSGLLDNLVGSAGEVSIYRARMEQQVAGLGSHLGELGQTIVRVKNQLRNLEAETDAQIHFSHRAESESRGEFDPLEMDRYTLIQELSKSLSESVNDLSSLQGLLGEQVKDSETLLLQQSRVNADLQNGLIKSRMVKFSDLLSRMRRLVRQSSQALAKKVELVIKGDENEVDNKVLDRMIAPLEHIIRNAISHGIENPVDRVKKGKPETGVIAIDISRDGSDIVIRVKDDGAGVNLDKVRSRALQLGLISDHQGVADNDLVQFILEPGFSTAEHVTQMSGRGVGMEVVNIEIKQLGGTLQIETNPQGTAFIARLPFTLSINQAILVRTDNEIYALPLSNIEGITRLETDHLVEQYQNTNPELDYAEQNFSLHYLSTLVESSAQFKAGGDKKKQPVIFSRSGDIRVALHVDEILGNREIVSKSLGKQLSQVNGLLGASILADGNVVLILDIMGLVRHSTSSSVQIVYSQDKAASAQSRNTVMVVDDSITMRRVATKLLQRHDYDVVTAKDGVDALSQLADVSPDVMLLDIEMPRMDGFELAKHMQNDSIYSDIPIIMITSRTGEKHRDRALEIGVSNYMGKPYQEDELIVNIQKALREAKHG
jgi:chemosensory pili system protein ChpA (sensor histidine kinase/response regulator)